MMAEQQLVQKLEKVYARYPQEQARLEEIARRILEMNRWLVKKAFENSLQKIIDAKTQSEAKRQIDSLEHILVTSKGFSFLIKIDSHLKKYLNIAIKVLLVIAVIFLLLGLILRFFN